MCCGKARTGRALQRCKNERAALAAREKGCGVAGGAPTRVHPIDQFVDVSVNTFGFGVGFLPRLLRFPPPDPTHIREPLLPQGHSYYPLKPKTGGVVTRDSVTTPPHSYIQIGERH